MAILLAGTNLAIIKAPTPSIVADYTQALNSAYDSAWVSSAVRVIGGSPNTLVLTRAWTPISEGWVHFVERNTTSVASAGYVAHTLRNNSNLDLFRLVTSGSDLSLEYRNSGGTYTQIALLPVLSVPTQVDMYFKIGASGRFEYYRDKALVAAVAADFSHMTTISHARLASININSSHDCYYSQLIVADEPTINMKLKQTLFTAAGTHQEWTGAVGAINEVAPDTTTSITADVAGARATYTAPARDFTGYAIKALIPQIRASRGGTAAPPKVAPLWRIGGTDYEGAPADLSYGLEYVAPVVAINPATGAPWTAAEAASAALEVGVKTLSA